MTMLFEDVLENYPDYLAEISDEEFSIEQDADWDESRWDCLQIETLKEIIAEAAEQRGW